MCSSDQISMRNFTSCESSAKQTHFLRNADPIMYCYKGWFVGLYCFLTTSEPLRDHLVHFQNKHSKWARCEKALTQILLCMITQIMSLISFCDCTFILLIENGDLRHILKKALCIFAILKIFCIKTPQYSTVLYRIEFEVCVALYQCFSGFQHAYVCTLKAHEIPH